MKKIIQLGEDLINVIGAGEILAEGSSFAKELIENSIDAGSTRIVINILIGLKTILKIDVKDDGCGIFQEDVRFICQRYHTSKLTTIDDLININTLGFRGEALNAMSQNAKLTITSNPNQEFGWQATFLQGKMVVPPQILAAPRGCLVSLENLFFMNEKKRNSCLKEACIREIEEIVRAFATYYRNQNFELSINNRIVFASTTNLSLDETFRLSYPEIKNKNLINVVGKDVYDNFSFECIVTGFDSQLSNEKVIFFVNNRLVFLPALLTIIKKTYNSLGSGVGKLINGYYVFGIFFVNSQLLDINVSANKREIKILKEKELYALFELKLSQELKSASNIKKHFANINYFSEVKNSPINRFSMYTDPLQTRLSNEKSKALFEAMPQLIKKVNTGLPQGIDTFACAHKKEISPTDSIAPENRSNFFKNLTFIGTGSGFLIFVQEEDKLSVFKGLEFLQAYLKFLLNTGLDITHTYFSIDYIALLTQIKDLFPQLHNSEDLKAQNTALKHGQTNLFFQEKDKICVLLPKAFSSYLTPPSVSYAVVLSSIIAETSPNQCEDFFVKISLFIANELLKNASTKKYVDLFILDAMEKAKAGELPFNTHIDKFSVLNLERAYKLFERC